MPKNKKLEDSSDSDSSSGPEDRNPPPKKAKTEEKSSSSKKSSSSGGGGGGDGGETSWVLDKKRQVRLNEFKGQVYVDIREFYEDPKSGDLKPGRKGISLSATQYQKLKQLIPEIDEALKNH